jgi:hypothetical protein
MALGGIVADTGTELLGTASLCLRETLLRTWSGHGTIPATVQPVRQLNAELETILSCLEAMIKNR